MKINTTELKKLIKQTQVNTTGNIVPILDFLVLEEYKGQIRMRNTNLNTFIYAIGDAVECEDGFACLLHRNEITELINYLPDTEIEITNDFVSGRVKIIWTQGEYFIFNGNINDYPVFLETEEYQNAFTIYGKEYANTYKLLSQTVGHDPFRETMNGLYCEVGETYIQITATDAISLSHIETLSPNKKGERSFDIIIPPETASILSKFSSEDDEIVILSNETMLSISVNAKVFILTKQITGKYPNYKSIIPKNNDKTLTIDRKVLKGSLERAIAFNNISLKEGIIFNLKSDGLFIGDYKEEVTEEDLFSVKERSACEYKGEELRIAFNPRIMLKMIKNIDADEITMTFSEYNKPVIITPVQNANNYYYLIMPIQLKDESSSKKKSE